MEALAAIRLLTGPAMGILMAMAVAGEPVTQVWLCDALGHDVKTVRKHLRFMRCLGYVERTERKRWRLGSEASQLPGFGLAAAEVSPDAGDAGEVNATREVQEEQGTGIGVGAAPPPAPTTTTCREDMVLKTSSSSRAGKRGEILPVPEELAAALLEAGIGRNAWRELAALPHVTPATVRAHWAKVRQHPDPGKRTTGFLIHVLRSGDPAPEVCEVCGGLDGAHGLDCREYYARYSKGKYARLWEHGGRRRAADDRRRMTTDDG